MGGVSALEQRRLDFLRRKNQWTEEVASRIGSEMLESCIMMAPAAFQSMRVFAQDLPQMPAASDDQDSCSSSSGPSGPRSLASSYRRRPIRPASNLKSLDEL